MENEFEFVPISWTDSLQLGFNLAKIDFHGCIYRDTSTCIRQLYFSSSDVEDHVILLDSSNKVVGQDSEMYIQLKSILSN